MLTMNSFPEENTPEALTRDVGAVARISAVPPILRVICERTAMGFAAVARVTDRTWTACAVRDEIQFGLGPGGQLDLKTTLCFESREARETIVIDDFSKDAKYCGHHTSQIYNLQSYISVPIVFSDGRYFGNLCAIDPRPRQLSDVRTISMFEAYAKLIALQLETEEQRTATEMALLDAQETAELREQFIAVLSHDLRNPLSAVSAIGELLAVRGGTVEVTKMGQRLRAITTRMAALIDDVMDFARGRMGSGIGVELKPVTDLEHSLHNVVAELQEANPAVAIEDRIAIDGTVHCDRIRVQQLLSNLLGNAVTHGAHDMPIVVYGHIDDQVLVLSVRNGGDVIGPDNIRKVFQPYWRPAEHARGGGLGLGLFICKQIVGAHGGDLEVTSSSSEGTCFMARLPIHGQRVF
jgi:signal transduction histidine kinase